MPLYEVNKLLSVSDVLFIKGFNFYFKLKYKISARSVFEPVN